ENPPRAALDQLQMDFHRVEAAVAAPVQGLKELFLQSPVEQRREQRVELAFGVFRLQVQRRHGAELRERIPEIALRRVVDVVEAQGFGVEQINFVAARLEYVEQVQALAFRGGALRRAAVERGGGGPHQAGDNHQIDGQEQGDADLGVVITGALAGE